MALDETIKKVKRICADLLKDVMDHIGLNEQEFVSTHLYYMMNPQTQQEIMQDQMMSTDSKGAPNFTRETTKKILLDSEERKFASVKKMI